MSRKKKVVWVERGDIYYRGDKCHGLTDHDTRTIEIDPSGISPRKLLFVELEELYHLLFPTHSERRAKNCAAFIGGELWRRGYKKNGVNRRTK